MTNFLIICIPSEHVLPHLRQVLPIYNTYSPPLMHFTLRKQCSETIISLLMTFLPVFVPYLTFQKSFVIFSLHGAILVISTLWMTSDHSLLCDRYIPPLTTSTGAPSSFVWSSPPSTIIFALSFTTHRALTPIPCMTYVHSLIGPCLSSTHPIAHLLFYMSWS